MRVLFDVNVLLALFDPRHIHHERAHSWWEQNRASGWASCPLTQNGFVRVLSQPGYPNSVTTSEAIRVLGEAVREREHAFWPDDVSIVSSDRFRSERMLGPKQVTDLYLLSLAVQRSGRLATFDRTIPLAAVVGATMRHLAVLS
ncbi:MAG: PIN domain-containing protein [Bryobacterales bacterium]|nr:PIN domain-containing protein [Bryobacterales bacterium]